MRYKFRFSCKDIDLLLHSRYILLDRIALIKVARKQHRVVTHKHQKQHPSLTSALIPHSIKFPKVTSSKFIQNQSCPHFTHLHCCFMLDFGGPDIGLRPMTRGNQENPSRKARSREEGNVHFELFPNTFPLT
jgi:hypothetical protein